MLILSPFLKHWAHGASDTHPLPAHPEPQAAPAAE
jgi:hypothetical protein